MMASAPSMSASVECVNPYKLSKGDGRERYECSVSSYTWKAPRALTGYLASTATRQYSLFLNGRTERRNQKKSSFWISKAFDLSGGYSVEVADSAFPGRHCKSSVLHVACQKWQLRCLPSFSESSDAISPETLWEDLEPTISYLPLQDLKLIHNALKLAFEAHDGQKRRSGEPYIIHPVEVARILGELELDWESIAAGLLHDTVEDTDVTFERIERDFGATVRCIVEGETKVSKLGKLQCNNANNSVQDVKADDLRQMFLAMTEEVRVIIVKIADRLHNMRTLSYMPQHKQSSIALETLQVFAPLAKLLGMYQIKSELENLSFMYTKAHHYTNIKRKVADLYKEHEKELVEAEKILMKKIEDDQFLDLMTVKTEVHSVCKEPYSIYKTMLKCKGFVNELNPIAQLHIIITPKPCIGVGPLCSSAQQICYHVLGLVHGIWNPIPGAMKDYIATPKPNGYQSLHTTVIPFLHESMFRLEVQIRTGKMDLIAQRGIAAHYSGRVFVTDLIGHFMPKGRNSTGKTVCLNSANISLRIGWLNAIREWQEEFVGNMSSREFVDTITRELLGSRVFVFTPQGEIKNLPNGATVIDYAYMIHTEIGNNMVAAKVNGNLVSPTHVLANAEVVEIITYNALSCKSAFQRHQQWVKHAKTRSARNKIMKFLREQAVISATEIMMDTVNDFIVDVNDESDLEEEFLDCSNDCESIWKKSLMDTEFPNLKMHRDNALCIHNGRVEFPKVNGKHNKKMQHMSLKANGELLSQGNGIAKSIRANIPMYKEVLPSLESWQASKVASWHNHEGFSIQWFCVVCIDRKGMLAEVTSSLTAEGITICSCVAEIDRRGMGAILFHVDGSLDSLVNATSSVDLILGVLGWSAGCSWPSSSDDHYFIDY